MKVTILFSHLGAWLLVVAGLLRCVAFTPSSFPRTTTRPCVRSFTGCTPRRAPSGPPHLLTSSNLGVRPLFPSNLISEEAVGSLIESLFRYNGNVPFELALGTNILLFGILSKKLLSALTPAGFAHSMALGTLLWTTLGWRGWTYCVLYLVMGQLVTKVKFADKEKRGLAESRGGRRGPENVWGSAATALACAACAVQGDAFLGIGKDVFILAYCASLATKLADTFASEIGKAYGKTTFLITSLKRVEPGTEGAISAEGTAAAAVGGLLLSLYGYSIGLLSDLPAVAVSTTAAFVATNIESLIGATLQEKEGLAWMTNEVVNFFNTLIGATIAITAGKLVLGMV